nr:hypothetical protein [Tanacetum cinerariifolium]
MENHFTFDTSSINSQASARSSIHALLGHDPGRNPFLFPLQDSLPALIRFFHIPPRWDTTRDFSDSNDESTSIDDDSFSIDDIGYVEASPPNFELVSSEVMEIVIPEVGGIDDDILLTIKDDILQETNTFDNSLPESETICFDLEEISSGSTTTRSDISLLEYKAFYDDHVKEITNGSTITHSDSSLYDSFIFDLSINLFPPADRSDFYEFPDELAHIISPPKLSIRESSRRTKNDSVKLEVKGKQGLFGNPKSSYVQIVSFSLVRS